MALYYSLVFSLLVIEMGLFTLLSLPLPRRFRRPLLSTVSKPLRSQEVQIAFRCILGFILVLFIDSVNRVFRVTAELGPSSKGGGITSGIIPSAIAPDSRAEIQARKFYAQRNMYLCGFTLFLTLILNRTYALVAELLLVKDQATSAEKRSSVDSDEVASLKRTLGERNDTIAILKEQAESLSKDYEEVNNEVKSKKKA